MPKDEEKDETSSSIASLLRTAVDGIVPTPIRVRILKLLENNHLALPLTRNALQEEARQVLKLLREGQISSENSRD